MNFCKEWRELRGYTQEKLSELSGVHRVTISFIETEHNGPRIETASKLATALGITLDQFFKAPEVSK